MAEGGLCLDCSFGVDVTDIHAHSSNVSNIIECQFGHSWIDLGRN